MPYKSEKILIKQTRHDRRRKLTPQDKEDIRNLYLTVKSQRKLAKMYGVSRRLITLILDPQKEKKEKEALKARKADGRYKPLKEDWAATIREHRKYKQQLYLKGEIREHEDNLKPKPMTKIHLITKTVGYLTPVDKKMVKTAYEAGELTASTKQKKLTMVECTIDEAIQFFETCRYASAKRKDLVGYAPKGRVFVVEIHNIAEGRTSQDVVDITD